MPTHQGPGSRYSLFAAKEPAAKELRQAAPSLADGFNGIPVVVIYDWGVFTV